MQIMTDSGLFRHAHGQTSEEYKDFARRAIDAQDAGSIAMLRSEIARIAHDINARLVPRNASDTDKVSMAKYLADQTAIVPLPRHYREKANTNPITVQLVESELREWGFEPTMIQVTFKKSSRFNSRDCYLTVSFARK